VYVQVYSEVKPGDWRPIGALSCKAFGKSDAVTLHLSCYNDDTARLWYTLARSAAAPSKLSAGFSQMKEQFLAWYASVPHLHQVAMRAHLHRQGLLLSALPPAPPALASPAVQQMRAALQKQARSRLEACRVAAEEHCLRLLDHRCVV
jgi:hypothetical protein